VTVLAVVRPLQESLHVFPFTEFGDWAASRLLWVSVLVAGASSAVVALAAPRWWLLRVRNARQG
jgi:hypothetical protein